MIYLQRLATKGGILQDISTEKPVRGVLIETRVVELLSQREDASAARQILRENGHNDISHHGYESHLLRNGDGAKMRIIVYHIGSKKDLNHYSWN